MSRLAPVLITLLLVAPLACWAGVTAVPDAVTPVLSDAQSPLQPDCVSVAGYLGRRITNSEHNRLLEVNEEELLGGFRHRPGSQDWIGEHIGKWIHAATLAWENTGDQALRAKLDRVVAELLKCQEPDGYLGTYLPQDRWGSWDVWVHKYDLMGLVTYSRYTGNPAALAGAKRIGDLLCRTFGKQPGQRDIIAAGTHMGMAATSVLEPMVLLYRQTGDPKYLDFCKYIVAAYEQPNGPKIVSTLLKGQGVNRVANGKAYEMTSNLVGLCELARTTGDRTLLQAVEFAWGDIVAKRLYITGSASQGECYQADYFLPNGSGNNCCETCVTTTWIQLNSQLLRLTGEAKYADQLERAIYNHLFGAQHPSGSKWCYYTALEGMKPYTDSTNCCLSSGPRAVALIPTIMFTASKDTISCNLYASARAEIALAGGHKVTVTEETRYPFDGTVRLRLNMAQPTQFTLRMRIPQWCDHVEWADSWSVFTECKWSPGSYAGPGRVWHDGDTVTLSLKLPEAVVVGDHGNAGKVAVTAGPLVLAADDSDNPTLKPLRAVSIAPSAKLTPSKSQPGTWDVPAELIGRTTAGQPGDKVTLEMKPFAEAGAEGGHYMTWFPQTGVARPQPGSVLAFGVETWSRQGNVEGQTADEDASTYRVTFNGQKADEDWYAVTLDKPVHIRKVAFAHGHCFHDGGWFDASQGKPRVQVQRTKGGAWETIATLDAYPSSTATDANGLQDGQSFAVEFAPTDVYGVRVIGRPACGDSPGQAFSSCAEVEGFE